MSNQPYRPGAFEIPCRAAGRVAEIRVPEDRPLSGVPAWLRPTQLLEVLKSFVVLPFRLQRLDRGFDGSPCRSGRVRA